MLSLMTLLAQTAATPTAVSGGAPGSGDDGMFLAWALALLAIALALFLVEMFVPSGGLLALLSTAALIGGLTLMFWEDTTFGLVTLIVVLLALPFAVGLMLKIMPSTPFIRALTLGSLDEDDAEASTEAAQGASGAGPHDHPLVGRTGQAVTDLRPVGMVMIDGKREECLAMGGMIDAGQMVEVVSVDGMQIKVRAR